MDRLLAGVAAKPSYKGRDMFMEKEDFVANVDNLKLGPKEKRSRLRYHDQEDNTMGKAQTIPDLSATKLSGKLFANSDLPSDKMNMMKQFVALQDLKGASASFSWAQDVDDVEDDERSGAIVMDDQDNESEGELVFYGPEDRPDERPAWQWNGLDPLPLNPLLDPNVFAIPDWWNTEPNNDKDINIEPNTKMRDDFRTYTQQFSGFGGKINRQLTKPQKRAIRLLHILKRKRAPLDTYDEVLEWHHRENGDITDQETLQHVNNVDEYISRPKILAFLKDRYNMANKFPHEKEVDLPNSKAKVKLTLHNAWDCIESLLTDPRVNDVDYSFHDNDPFAPPPAVWGRTISDLHTGQSFSLAYRKYITKPNQVLLPILMYIDGAVTGQFANLPITALKISLGIHNRKYRDKSHAWRTLGYVAQISKPKSRGKRLYRETGHLDGQNYDLEGEEGQANVTQDACKAQDYHTMLDAILESYLDVQDHGFIWDLRYRGKTYKDVEFVPYVMFVKCDTDEADILCGSYKSRGAGVAQLCRYCTCPTQESDLVLANFPIKTTPMIAALVAAEDFEGLKKLSQQMIQNAWYKIRFTPKANQGIHGACPSEMLHALQLGVFKYIRECFFEQIGPTSALAEDINALAQQYGDKFARQSERDMPKCKFSQGIQKGKLMANEFRGILLVMAAVIRSEKGQTLLRGNKNFSDPRDIENWGLLVEMVLEWEAFLNEPEMTHKHIYALRTKNRYIMYLVKKVTRRNEGMGWKLMKFHVIIHMWLDILLYGVPKEVDTGSNESGHKETKVAARLTQKNEATFDFQTCTRMDEFMCIDLAMAELTDDQAMWKYFLREEDPEPPDPPPFPQPCTSGLVINVFKKEQQTVYSLGKGPKSKQPAIQRWDNDVIDFLYELQQKLGISNLRIRGTHTRENQIFRGSPRYRDEIWRDWALFDWGGPSSTLPGQIWCFVVVNSLPKGEISDIHHGGILVENAHYAVVECADYATTPRAKKLSDIFMSINKEVAQTADGDRPWRRKFYLANVEAITSPLVVVPNIGGKKGTEFFIVRQREEWVTEFKKWLDAPSIDDVIGAEEPKPSHFI
jgi:hypothetical protein